jgi:hypothetical protein
MPIKSRVVTDSCAEPYLYTFLLFSSLIKSKNSYPQYPQFTSMFRVLSNIAATHLTRFIPAAAGDRTRNLAQ